MQVASSICRRCGCCCRSDAFTRGARSLSLCVHSIYEQFNVVFFSVLSCFFFSPSSSRVCILYIDEWIPLGNCRMGTTTWTRAVVKMRCTTQCKCCEWMTKGDRSILLCIFQCYGWVRGNAAATQREREQRELYFPIRRWKMCNTHEYTHSTRNSIRFMFTRARVAHVRTPPTHTLATRERLGRLYGCAMHTRYMSCSHQCTRRGISVINRLIYIFAHQAFASVWVPAPSKARKQINQISKMATSRIWFRYRASRASVAPSTCEYSTIDKSCAGFETRFLWRTFDLQIESKCVRRPFRGVATTLRV